MTAVGPSSLQGDVWYNDLTVTPIEEPIVTSAPLDEALDYFLEIALEVEYGSRDPIIVKWMTDPTVQMHGTPTAGDRAILSRVVSELNELVGSITLGLVEENAAIDIHFVPVSRMPSILPEYVPGNWGYVHVRWRDWIIFDAVILIASDLTTQIERSHLIREELTQALGLMQDSHRYPDSIFYGPWTTVTEYADIDRDLIRILYMDGVTPGMTRDEVRVFVPVEAQGRDDNDKELVDRALRVVGVVLPVPALRLSLKKRLKKVTRVIEQGVVHIITHLGGCTVGLPIDREWITASLREYARRQDMMGLNVLDPSADDLGEGAEIVEFAIRDYEIEGPVLVGTHRGHQVLLGLFTLYGLPSGRVALGDRVVKFSGSRGVSSKACEDQAV